MKTPVRVLGSTFLIAALAAPAVQAQEERRYEILERDEYSGFFVSGSYGGFRVDSGDLDDDGDFLGASVGWYLNRFIGFELDYIDFGNFGEDDVDADLKGFSLTIQGRIPVTDVFGVYARAGAFASSFDFEQFEEDETYDDINPVYGVGVDFRAHEKFTVFAQYDRYNVDIDESDFTGQIADDEPEFDTARLGVRFVF